eukprot:TRINITY_DN2579_c0_g1_i1.p1 TRINITY_DN2579_c0_g1~~TRINITY_DN2579_c0_g1_i1.p1  ORF type:complete len:395 (+),score=135.19 TRINITY_DN2579_c0_g1_i1:51-1235(+)
MSGADHAILDLGEDDLQFTTTDYKAQASASASLTQFPNPSPDRDTDRLITDGEGQGGPGEWKTSNFWTLAFYQQFFDVDTTDVKNRLIYSMVPVPGKSFLQHHIRPRPDLYGPFWICCTLVFSIAISGNLADFLQKSVDPEQGTKWHYDFHKVTLAATAVFSYAGLVPASLYGFLWWSSSGAGAATLSFLELVCLYGYSLAIYIPVSLLWLVQVSWWQWLCVLAGAGLSGYVLFLPIWPAVRDQAAKSAVIVMAIVLALHLLLACGFMLYFFHVPAVAAGSHNTTQTVVTVAPAVDEKTLENNKAAEETAIKDAEKVKDEADKAALVDNAEGKGEEKRSNKPEAVLDENDNAIVDKMKDSKEVGVEEAESIVKEETNDKIDPADVNHESGDQDA